MTATAIFVCETKFTLCSNIEEIKKNQTFKIFLTSKCLCLLYKSFIGCTFSQMQSVIADISAIGPDHTLTIYFNEEIYDLQESVPHTILMIHTFLSMNLS